MKMFQKNVRLSIWIWIMKVKQFWLKSHGKEFENCIIIEFIKYTIHANEEEGKKRGKEIKAKGRHKVYDLNCAWHNFSSPLKCLIDVLSRYLIFGIFSNSLLHCPY